MIAFVQGWLLTLVMLASIPPIVVAGAAMTIMVSKMASRGQTAYAAAGVVVEQTIGSIRTVCATWRVHIASGHLTRSFNSSVV